MRRVPSLAGALFAAALAFLPPGAGAQGFAANYDITNPGSVPLRFGPGYARSTAAGPGLSLQAGQDWFAAVSVGRSLETDTLGLGAGYRWSSAESLSMQVQRAVGQTRLGLALRYDRQRYYLGLSYDPRAGDTSPDTLRFSAGVRF